MSRITLERQKKTNLSAYVKKTSLALISTLQGNTRPSGVTKTKSAVEAEPSKQRHPTDWPQEEYDPELFLAGEAELLSKPSLAVIGTRTPTDKGIQRTQKLIRFLCSQTDLVIMSGLARGIDTVAIQETLDCGKRVIAVLATPLEEVRPSCNTELQSMLAQKHLLVSQTPPGTAITQVLFPRRNVLMAALSKGTIIVEAGETSGTRYQAQACLALGRPLFVPQSMIENGPIWIRAYLRYPKVYVVKAPEEILRILAL